MLTAPLVLPRMTLANFQTMTFILKVPRFRPGLTVLFWMSVRHLHLIHPLQLSFLVHPPGIGRELCLLQVSLVALPPHLVMGCTPGVMVVNRMMLV